LEIALSTAAPNRRAYSDFSFLLKVAFAALLVALADWLFYFHRAGSTLGLYAAAVLAVALAAHAPLRRRRSGWAAAAFALIYAAALADDPSLLAVALFWASASLAVLLPRTRGFDTATRAALHLPWQAVRSLVAMLDDVPRLHAARRRRRGAAGLSRRLAVLVLPAVGSALFLGLFAAANPLISDAFSRISLSGLFGGVSGLRLLFWAGTALPLWALMRPRLERSLRRRSVRERGPASSLPGTSRASVALSLAAFNLVFALQNGLDIAFLWSGAALPEGMTLADYAHRGAYPLIGTALLAGLFVLVTLRPGSPLAQSAAIRRMVYLWIGQNILLVASTALRTIDYVEAYSLTRLRIAALLWMALVAAGLILICWRIARERSGAWLINANAAAALAALTACAFVDLGALAAGWNVRHARDAGGTGAAIDLCYLRRLGPSALPALVELEARPLSAPLRDRVASVRSDTRRSLEQAQADWHGWTWRNQRRLAEVRRLTAPRPLPGPVAGPRACDGSIPAAALTAAPQR